VSYSGDHHEFGCLLQYIGLKVSKISGGAGSPQPPPPPLGYVLVEEQVYAKLEYPKIYVNIKIKF